MVIGLVLLVLGAVLIVWAVFVIGETRKGRAATQALQSLMADADAQRQTAVAIVSGAVAKVDGTLGRLGQTLEASVAQLQTLDTTLAERPAPRVRQVQRGNNPRVVSIASAPVPAGHAKRMLDIMFEPHGHDNSTVVRTLGLSPHHPVSFVVPTLGSSRPAGTSARSAVASEDMLAAKAVGHLLLRGWPDAQVSTRTVDPGAAAGDLRGNVCTFCRDERNPVTAAFLTHPDIVTALGISFPKVPSQFRRHSEEATIVFGDGMPRRSPSYKQEWDIGDDEATVALEDLAVLARVENPFDPGAKVLIVAGVRAFGTLGAAEYLRLYSDTLFQQTVEKDFAALIKVTATYQVTRNPEVTSQLDDLFLASTVELVPVDEPPSVEMIDVKRVA